MKTTDILIIGGGPAGAVAAITAKKNYPSKQTTLIRKEKKSVIPCGIPYIFNRLNSVDDNIMPDQPLLDAGVNLIIGEAVKIMPKEKTMELKNKDVCGYDKLILALGSKPQLIPIPGIDKKGVWLVKKDYEYLKKFREAARKSREIVIIGGGFIGIEFAEELSALKNLNISIVEALEHCLVTNFDAEFTAAAEEKIKNKGVKIYSGRKVKEITGRDKIEHVLLDSGERLKADLAIVSIGACPNTELAKRAGIKTEEPGGIRVDEYLKTSAPDIFAVGDCAQTRDFITGKNRPIMLASVAASEARIAASNLYAIKIIRENKGTVGAFSTCIGGLVIGAAGLTEQRAREEGIDYIVGEAEAPNHHPAKLKNTKIYKVKLIFSKSSENLLLGGEISGPESASEMINILAMAIQQKASLFDFNAWQIATHPLITPSPTVYPLITAAQNALLKL